MFKYKHILDNMSIGQKVRLLTDAGALNEIEFKALGIPSVTFGDFNEYCERSFPSVFTLSRTFDRELIGKIAKTVFRDMGREGVNCALLKGPKIKINPYDNSYSEDVEITVAIVGEILRVAAEMSMAVCLTDFNISSADVQWMDKKPDMRIVRDYFVKPFERVIAHPSCIGLFCENVREQSDYFKVNEELQRYALDGKLGNFGGFLLCQHTRAHDTVNAICSGKICLEASANILKAAADKYVVMKDGISKGKVTVGELIDAEEAGEAISPQNIDIAVSRLIDFATECSKTNVSLLDTDNDALVIRERSYRESTVMLKNMKGVIPVGSKDKIAIVGDIINYPDKKMFSDESEKYVSYLENLGFQVEGYASGYDIGDVLSKERAAAACELAKNCSKVIVFLGKTHESEKRITKTENLYLDANQLYLVESLANYKHKIIYVLSSEYALDATFSEYGAGLILIPDTTQTAVLQALNVIIGVENAEGKLAKPMYFNTRDFEKGRLYRKYHNELVGAFMGYRYINSASLGSTYSLGSGIINSSIKYSNLKITDSGISFNVKNTSKRTQSDVAQIYIEAINPATPLPKKELIGFERIILDGGQSKTVVIENNYSLFDKEKGKYIFPSGEYRVCLGASIDETHLSIQKRMGNEELSSKANYKLSDYLQSESNILSDKYTLEADYKLMKKSYRNIIFGVGAMLIAIVLALLSMAAGINSMFIYIISAILLVASIVFFVLHGVDGAKLSKLERVKIDAANKKQFDDAEKVSVSSAEQMFVAEFDRLDLEVEDNDASIDYMEEEYFKFVNKEFKFNDLVADFDLFAKEKGYKFDMDMIREIFSAIASSRLIITKMDDEYYTSLVTLLCEYFEAPVCIDRVDIGYTTEDSVLIKTLEDGSKTKTNAMRGLEYAGKSLQNMFVVAFSNVSFKDISNYFVPYAKYVRNPLSNIYVHYQDENGADKKIAITKNVWFMMNIASDEIAYNMPTYLGETSATLKIEFTKCAPAEANPELNKIKYYQFDYMLDKAKNHTVVSEDSWKKIDKLQNAVGADNNRKLTNKLTVGFEKYVNVYSLCGGDNNEGFNCALCAKLLPYFASENCEAKEISAISEALESVFGEENAQKCQRALKENAKLMAN